jgi:hypothetical protein
MEAKEREKQLALAAELEKQKALAAQQAIEKVKAEDAQKIREVDIAISQALEEVKSRKESLEKQFEIQKSEWDKIKDSKNSDDYYAYLNKYPNGFIAQQAIYKLESLAKAKIESQPDKNGLVQKLGEPRFRIGDAWVISIRDDYSGNIIKRVSNKVTKIENDLVFIENDFGQEIRTLDGGVIKTNVTDNKFSYDPPRIDMPGDELIVGKKWSMAYNQTDASSKGTLRQDAKIVALENVTTPAGTFLAYKIEVDGYIGVARTRQIYWCEPSWGERIKWIRTVIRPRGTLHETYELESRIRGPLVSSKH